MELKELNISLDNYKGKWVILLFYPMDWTFVCPTEIFAYNDAADKLAAVNTVVLGISGDSPYTHLSWLKASRSEGGLGGLINIPLLSDVTRETMKNYGVYTEKSVLRTGTKVIKLSFLTMQESRSSW